MSQQARSLFNLSVPAAPSAVLPYRFVDYLGAQATVQGQKVAGVSNRGAAQGQPYDATVIGTAIIEAGGAFPVGQALISDAVGRAIANGGALNIKAGAIAVTSLAANGAGNLGGSDLPEYVACEALQAAINAGDLVEVLLRR